MTVHISYNQEIPSSTHSTHFYPYYPQRTDVLNTANCPTQ